MGHSIRKGASWRYIRSLKQGHKGTQLRPKIDGKRGKEIDSNKGSPQGRPLSAQIFAIYFDAMINGYYTALRNAIKHTQPGKYERHGFEAIEMPNRLWGKADIGKK